MSKFKANDRVRILEHKSPKHRGKEALVAVPIRVDGVTAGVTEDHPVLPPGKLRWVYLVDIDDSPSERVQCEEDWLEAI